MEEIIKNEMTCAENEVSVNETAPVDAGQEVKSAEAEFQELIKGKYKNEFQKKVDGIIGARFRENRREERLKAEEAEWMSVYKALESEAEAVKGLYPDFDIRSELQNPRFRGILRNPEVDMRTAYEIVHHDELFSSAMSAAARVAREKTVEEILSAAARPSDTASVSSGNLSTNVRALSKKEREEFARRARRGERVTFR